MFHDAAHPLLDNDFALEEVEKAIGKSKNGKSPGVNLITYELIKGIPLFIVN